MNSKKEQLLKKAYDEYINLMLYDFPVDRINEIVVEDVSGFGTTLDEKVLEIKRLKKIVTDQREQGAGIDMQIRITPIHRRISPGEDTFIYMDEFEISMLVDGTKNVIPVRLTSVFEFCDQVWKLVHLHGSKAVETEDDTWHLNECKQKSEQLQKLVDDKTAELTKQNRELEIEAALEKVRSKSLSMQKSDELKEVVAVLFQKLQDLGFGIDQGAALVMTYSPESKDHTQWITDSAQTYTVPFFIPFSEHSIALDQIDARDKGLVFLSKIYDKKEKDDYFKFLFQNTEYRKVPGEVQDMILNSKKFGISVAFEKHSAIAIPSSVGKLVSGDEINILKRFAKVFEQTYTRFLDLQKAEAQAREAQIQLSLERVRARTMAMQHSSELAEASQLLYQQFHSLGIKTFTCAYMFVDEENNKQRGWAVAADGTLLPNNFVFPLTGDNVLDQRFESWKNRKPLHETEIHGEASKRHHEFVVSLQPPEFAQQIINHLPDQVYFYNANFSYGYLFIVNTVPLSPEEKEIAVRFAKVFEQTYTRFLDLQKAEAQAREAQIEAALERVRARTMGMQKSEDLREVVRVLYTQLKELGFEHGVAAINIMDEVSGDVDCWSEGFEDGYDLPEKYHVPYFDHPGQKEIIGNWKKGIPYAEIDLKGQEKKELDDHYFFHSDFARVPETTKQFMMQQESIRFSMAYMQFGALTWTPTVISNEQAKVLQRFAKVFEQTYTRFLDLQKAEAQAREAQIEAALERVRSRSLAMHRSDELELVAASLFEAIVGLGIAMDGALIFVFNRDNRNIILWVATVQLTNPVLIDLPCEEEMQDNEIIRDYWKAADQGQTLSKKYTGETKNEYFRYVQRHNCSKIPDNIKKLEIDLPAWHLTFAAEKNTMLGLDSWSGYQFTESDLNTLKRFAKVFEQAYIRFLDLQKAEAQAREAQIEAALERVRASSMAMHKSEQLAETTKVLFEQFDLLGKIPDRISIGFIKEEKQLIEWWVTNQNGSQLNYGFNASIAEPSMAKVFTAWKEKKESIVIDLTGNDLKDWIRFVREEVKMEIDEANMKGRRIHQGAFFSQGVLLFSTHEPVASDVMQLLVRFARVFNQTYTRFLDLQKAEMQAKEAIKASSLDRVRGEIASMRTVDDLQRITPIFWHELNALGVPFIRCGVFIINVSTSYIQVFLSAPDGKSLAAMDLPFNSSELTINSVNHWRQGIIFKKHWNKEEFLNFMQSMIKEGQVLSPETYQGAATPPESLYLHFVPFKQGMLYVGNTSPLEKESLELVKALAESFSIAYARYEDFKNLEEAKNQIEKTLIELKATQSQLIQSEKMASLGELTAGIAHEIQNPLNFVNNFSELSNELMDELKSEKAKSKSERDEALEDEILNDIKQNLQKINHHGKRAADIVKGMLQHSRTSSGQKEPTDINALADEYIRLAYHGLRAKDKSFNAEFKTDFDPNLPKINVVPQDIGRVLLNLINNAFYAVSEKLKQNMNDFKPMVVVTTKFTDDYVEIKVQDNGSGIPESVKDKIFQPFFTTKPTGQGTGLGLSLSYDVIKAHGGELQVETKEGEGSVFTINLKMQ